MNKIFNVIAMLFGFSLLLIGCNDRNEIDHLAHVVVIGIDLPEEKEKYVQFEYSFQIANPQVGSSERAQAEQEPSSDIITVRASDIVAAKKLASASVTRSINFGHLQVVIVSEELARSDLLHNMIIANISDPEFRREVDFFVSKEKAREFIEKNKPKLETRPHKYYELMRSNWRTTGQVPTSTFNEYFQRLSGELYLAIYCTTERQYQNELVFDLNIADDYTAGQVPQLLGDPAQILGSAVIKNGKMIGTLTGIETSLALMLRPKEDLAPMYATFTDPLDDRFMISVRYDKQDATNISIDVKQDPTKVEVVIPLKAQLLSVPSLNDYVYNEKNQQKLKDHITRSLEESFVRLVKKMQQEYQSEPFLWHTIVRKKFWTNKQYEEYKWLEKFPNAKVNIKVDLEIESFGKQYQIPKMKHHFGDEK